MKTRPVLIPTALLLVAILSLTIAPALAAAPRLAGEGQFIQVTVKPGDSLAKYAFTYGTSGSAMLAVNTLPNPDLIYPGQVITIPVIKTQTPSLTTPFYYIAQNGDTLTSVGKKFHLDGYLIGIANNTSVDLMVPGAEYVIPAGPHYEIILPGQHLGIIAAMYGTTIDKLMTANPQIGDPVLVSAGLRVNVPILFDSQPVAIPPAPVVVTATTGPGTPTSTTVVIVATSTQTAVPSATATNAPPATSTPKPTATSIAAANNYITTVVQLNESLVTYVRRFGVSGSAILNVNPKLQANPDLLLPGDVVTIPVVISYTPSRSTPFFYTVQGGDTVFSIAAKFEMSTDTLIAANPKVSFGAGSTVLIPAGPHIYIVQPGESMLTVAAKYLITLDKLMAANPSVPSPTAVFAGQQVFIPTRIDAAPVPFN